MIEYAINKEIVFSTAHISLETNLLLHDAPMDINLGGCVDAYAYGCKIFMSGHETGIPELDALIKIAEDNDCKWLVLDCDGPKYDHLKQCDW